MRPMVLGLAACLAFGATAGAAAGERVFARSADGSWQPLPCTVEPGSGALRFTLDPAQVGGESLVVIDPPPGLALDDAEPPRFTGLKFDGRPYPIPRETLDLDWLPAHPEVVTIGLQDAANPLDLSTLRVSLNGVQLQSMPELCVAAEPGVRNVRVTLATGTLLRAQGLFRNEIRVSIADMAPERNEVAASIHYYCLQGLQQVPAVLTDSAHEGYEDLSVLTDGVVMQPGVTTYGVTWASREVAGDHWVVLAWPEERVWRGVEVFWATYSGTYWGSRQLLVQTWDGSRWITQRTVSHAEGEPSTATDLGGVRSSRLRLVQPDGQGHAARPDIMWITEVRWE